MTRIPLGPFASHDPADLPASAVYFPVVGVLIALAGGITLVLASHVWSPLVAVVLSTGATVLLTGAFHEDALADALDGFGGGWTRDRVLEIMKDSRVGSYALVGVVLTIGVKIASLAGIATRDGVPAVVRALVAGHVLARWSSIPLIWRYSYVRPTNDGERPSAGQPFVAGITTARLVAATLVAAIVIFLAIGARDAIIVAVVSLGITALAGRYFAHRIGGITGDALGAANQLIEVAVYLTLTAHYS